MKDVLQVFKEKGHKYKIGDDWDLPDGERTRAEGAWYFAEELPLLAVVGDCTERGFDPVNYVCAKHGSSELGSYVPLGSTVASRSFTELGYEPKPPEIRTVNRMFANFISGID